MSVRERRRDLDDLVVDSAGRSPASAHSVHLLNGDNAERYRHWVSAGVGPVVSRVRRCKQPFPGITPEQLAPDIAAVDLDTPLGDVTAALNELERVYLRDAVWFHHPRYLAHLNCPVVIPALLGEAVLSAVNSSMDTWDQSAGATLIERRLIEWTAARLGLGPDADGVFTSGGTQSNLHALLLAREEACRLRQREGEKRVDVLPRLRVFASECAHFSVTKSARLLGLAEDAVVPIACDKERRMRDDALARAVERCLSGGLIPMAVVATAGTTDFGSIDPLPEIADHCRRFEVWLHVDAAYGCGLLVSRRRHLLAGIEHADSVTVDFHKSFFQPVSSSAVVVRDRSTLAHVTYHADYLNPTHAQLPNQVDKSIQTTRRFDALKLWLTLRVMGADGVGALFDAVLDRAEQAWALLEADPRFDVVVRPRLSTLVFRYVPPDTESPERVDQANLWARAAVMAAGEAMVAATVVDGRHYLKFTLLNPCTELRDIAEVLDRIAEYARGYLEDSHVHA
ncbi:MAG: pyridoxal-dependent decarboxylase [Actinobacteria bacterium]|nr:MAG: pyridoxal-dependent decarboxylase [Actinomycetota bacterium]